MLYLWELNYEGNYTFPININVLYVKVVAGLLGNIVNGEISSTINIYVVYLSEHLLGSYFC